MKNISLLIFGLLGFTVACSDADLDPLQFEKITKGSVIALRGPAVDILNTIAFRGAVDTFSLTADPATQNFEFEADFLSDDPSSLAEVQLYARATAGGPRVRISTVSGSMFMVPAGGKYPRASFSVPLNTILTAVGVTLADLSVNDYLYIEADLMLSDGTLVPASSIVNNSLFESDLFYPAHNLLYLVI